MLGNFQKLSKAHRNLVVICSRNLTGTEVSTALRPFYFSVHPDLFGKYPNERAINESSLQQLSSILANIQAYKPFRPIVLPFYIKDKTKKEVPIQRINVHIKDTDIRSVITTILKSCGLPTDYVDNIIKTPTHEQPTYRIKYNNDIDFTKVNQNHPIFAHVIMQKKIKEAKEALRLQNWLKTNFQEALDKNEEGTFYREEIKNLQKTIMEDIGLKEMKWECGWNETHFRGCLLSFKSLIEQHPEIKPVLKGRLLVFSYFTGVSLEGHIMLYSGEVRHNWLDFLKNIPKYDAALLRIPAFERSLSHVLRNIKVGRRKFMPKIVAGAYEDNLRQITTSLNDYIGKKFYPKEWPDSLEEFQIVVETEAGPLMVSPTGQFIVPCTIPGGLLVHFITKHLKEAELLNRQYQSDKHLERDLRKKCIEELKLAELIKEDNITPDLMIKCCQKLLNNKDKIKPYTENLHVNISTYYSVLTDGVACIPWNFEL